jgi:hypothetical protein
MSGSPRTAELIVAGENKPDSITNSDVPDFLVFDEGSFFGLEKSPARMWFDRFSLRQQVMLAVSVTWIPLAVLAAIQGVAIGLTQPRSFLEDAGLYARFFVALPLLLVTPSKCRHKFQQIMRHFLSSGLVKEADRERFLAILTSTMRLRNSRLADWVCLVLAYSWSAAFVFLPALTPAIFMTWRAVGSAGQRSFSLAAWYLVARKGSIENPSLSAINRSKRAVYRSVAITI